MANKKTLPENILQNTIVIKSDKIKVTPDHDFDILKNSRLQTFEEETQRYIDAGVNIDREISWKEWLNDEIKFIDKRIKDFDKFQVEQPILYKGFKSRKYNWLKYNKFILEQINVSNKVSKAVKNDKTLLSYQWQNTPEDLKELFDKIKSNLIAEDTEWKNFKKVFSGTPVNQFEPIKWHDDNATELIFFIQHLENIDGTGIKANIDKSGKRRSDFIKLKSCFVKSDGSQFNENLRQLAQNAEFELKEDKQEFIKNLL
jgi:hypothetical protein